MANYLAAMHKNLYCIGDLDQSIYSFRGADYRNILYFEKDWPDAKIITYDTETYLSHQPASSFECEITAKGHNVSQPNRLFQIMTIRKPYRYVLTCRAEPKYFVQAQDAINLITTSFLITKNIGAK